MVDIVAFEIDRHHPDKSRVTYRYSNKKQHAVNLILYFLFAAMLSSNFASTYAQYMESNSEDWLEQRKYLINYSQLEIKPN